MGARIEGILRIPVDFHPQTVARSLRQPQDRYHTP
jgi:hypothetical protein